MIREFLYIFIIPTLLFRCVCVCVCCVCVCVVCLCLLQSIRVRWRVNNSLCYRIKDTMNVPDDHSFGILVRPDPYGKHKCVHNWTDRQTDRETDRQTDSSVYGLFLCLLLCPVFSPGAGDLIHNRIPKNYLRGKDHERGMVAAIRQHLKIANFHYFDDLHTAFQYYDKVQ